MTLEQQDQEAAAVQKTPNRVTLEQMEARIVQKLLFTPDELLPQEDFIHQRVAPQAATALPVLTICVLVLDNGWTLVGKSAPADPKNYDQALGEKLAYEHALEPLWALEAYLLRGKMHALEAEVDALPSSDAEIELEGFEADIVEREAKSK